MLPATIAEADPELRARIRGDRWKARSELYSELVAAGIPGEDARFVFPNATRTNLVMTANLRALIHMSGLRLCTMAQWEIRRLFQLDSPRGLRRQPVPGQLPRAQVRADGLLRRSGQPRRALPDPPAQGRSPGGLGGTLREDPPRQGDDAAATLSRPHRSKPDRGSPSMEVR